MGRRGEGTCVYAVRILVDDFPISVSNAPSVPIRT